MYNKIKEKGSVNSRVFCIRRKKFSKETQYIESVYLNPAYKKTHEKYMNA